MGDSIRLNIKKMQVTREDLNPCTIKLSIEVDPQMVSSGYDKAIKKIAKEIKLPGFRPGHAPRNMVEKVVNPERWNEEAIELILRGSLDKAIKDGEINADPNTRPSINLEELNRENSICKYTAKIALPPIIKMAPDAARKLPVEKRDSAVTEEEISHQIDELRKKSSTRETLTERGLMDGDVAFVNIKPEDTKIPAKSFMTIAGQTFPVLDEALMGMKAEEMKNLELTFPATFQEKSYAGKTMNCQVTLNSASSVKMPEVTDEFAKSLNAEGVEDLRQRLSDQIGAAKANMVREMMIEEAMEKLLERSEVEVSDNSWEEIANRRLQETAQEQRQQGRSLEQYASENGMTVEQLHDAWKEKAQMYIKRAFLIREIFTLEKMQLENRDLTRELIEMAYENQVSPEEMYQYLLKNNSVEEVRFRAISRKVSDFLLEHADIKDESETSKPEAKAKAKPKAEKVVEAAAEAKEEPKPKAKAKKKDTAE